MLLRGVDQFPLGGSPFGDRLDQSGSRIALFDGAVGGEGGVEVGQLAGEAPVGETEWLHAEGERVVGATAGQGDGRPVAVEPVDTGGDGVASPSFGPLELVVRALLTFELLEAMFGPCQDAGGVDHGLLLDGESVLELASLSPTGAAQGPERSLVVDVSTGCGCCPFRHFELSVSGGDGAAGVSELSAAVGRLALQHGVVGVDDGSEAAGRCGQGSSTAAMVVSGIRASAATTCWGAVRRSASRPP